MMKIRTKYNSESYKIFKHGFLIIHFFFICMFYFKCDNAVDAFTNQKVLIMCIHNFEQHRKVFYVKTDQFNLKFQTAEKL